MQQIMSPREPRYCTRHSFHTRTAKGKISYRKRRRRNKVNSSLRKPFEPAILSIPANMSVIWFNDDQSEHSVAVNASSSDVPPEAVFDSDLIDPNGGSFIHKFTIPRTYDYYDSINSLSKSSIKMGSEFEGGQNMTC